MDNNSGISINYSKRIAETEKHILEVVLNWKLCYTTPFDYIHILAYKFQAINPQFHKVAEIIVRKAVQISELLLICIPQLNN